MTREIEAGWYAYGLATYDSTGKENWKSDPLNTTVIKNGNSGISVPGIRLHVDNEVQIGTSSTVIDAVYYTGDGLVTKPVILSMTGKPGVTIEDNKLVVPNGTDPGMVEVIATYEGWSFSKEIELSAVKLTSPVIFFLFFL